MFEPVLETFGTDGGEYPDRKSTKSREKLAQTSSSSSSSSSRYERRASQSQYLGQVETRRKRAFLKLPVTQGEDYVFDCKTSIRALNATWGIHSHRRESTICIRRLGFEARLREESFQHSRMSEARAEVSGPCRRDAM
ncbi:uncharacterized protein LOC122532846 [Frieseomelitta varia]|uniref:uncharacterized protein LOC122532846 n=1 Tax=Frieseomelitta varia TaxID=561572 RepID=UPI001CB684A8|nr:uncharacterized protein LOC122532846 [Frieseomelitta varia]